MLLLFNSSIFDIFREVFLPAKELFTSLSTLLMIEVCDFIFICRCSIEPLLNIHFLSMKSWPHNPVNPGCFGDLFVLFLCSPHSFSHLLQQRLDLTWSTYSITEINNQSEGQLFNINGEQTTKQNGDETKATKEQHGINNCCAATTTTASKTTKDAPAARS